MGAQEALVDSEDPEKAVFVVWEGERHEHPECRSRPFTYVHRPLEAISLRSRETSCCRPESLRCSLSFFFFLVGEQNELVFSNPRAGQGGGAVYCAYFTIKPK